MCTALPSTSMCPRIRLLHPRQDVDQGRLAGPVLAQEGVNLAAPEIERNGIIGKHTGEPFGDPA